MEAEQRRDERVLLDRVVDRLGALSGWPSGRPVLDPPKTLEMSPGPARTQNRPILNRICIEKYTDFDGRRIREFCPPRTRPDLVSFGPLAGSVSAGRRLGLVLLLRLLRRLQDGVFHLQDLRLQVAQVFGGHSCRFGSQ